MTGAGLAAVKADVAVLSGEAGAGRVLEAITDLRAPGGGKLIDLSCPACAVFGGTLSAMPADVARKTVAAYAEALAPGSCVIISCASYADPELAAKVEAMFGPAGDWRNHPLAGIESFFAAAGLRVVRGRVADVRSWPMLPADTPDVCVLGGIGLRD